MLFAERLAQARREAQQLHRRFGVERLEHVDVYAFAERLRVRIVDVPLDGAVAQLIVTAHRKRILISNRLADPALRRVAIAHELGHLLLKHPTEPLLDSAAVAPAGSVGCRLAHELECAAHGFALELLAPARAVHALRRCAPDLALCSHLATTAWMPIEYAANRIAEVSERACAAVLSDRSGILSVTASRAFSLVHADALRRRLQPGEQLGPDTLAARILARHTPCKTASVRAESWVGARRRGIWESAAPVGWSGCVLSMLWDPQADRAMRIPTNGTVH